MTSLPPCCILWPPTPPSDTNGPSAGWVSPSCLQLNALLLFLLSFPGPLPLCSCFIFDDLPAPPFLSFPVALVSFLAAYLTNLPAFSFHFLFILLFLSVSYLITFVVCLSSFSCPSLSLLFCYLLYSFFCFVIRSISCRSGYNGWSPYAWFTPLIPYFAPSRSRREKKTKKA